MARPEEVKNAAEYIIESGEKPTAGSISAETDFTVADVHRCLNALEKRGEVETYSKEVFGSRHRFVSVKR